MPQQAHHTGSHRWACAPLDNGSLEWDEGNCWLRESYHTAAMQGRGSALKNPPLGETISVKLGLSVADLISCVHPLWESLPPGHCQASGGRLSYSRL